MERFLCITSSFLGQDFLRQCADSGVQPTLLTVESLRDANWPREALEDLATMPIGLTRQQLLNTISWMARGRQFHRIVALDEASMLEAAAVREHMRVPGMGLTTAGYYQDRLAMRVSARESGFVAPDFCRVLNYDDLREFMEQRTAPWVLTPRVACNGRESFQIEDPEELWRKLDQLGDLQSQYVLEELLAGEEYIVASILSERRVVFSLVVRRVKLAGGLEAIEVVDRMSRDWMELTALNAGLAPSLGMVRGLTEAHFVRRSQLGGYCFERIAPCPGASGVTEVVEAASELSLWREWARIEVAQLRGTNYIPSQWFDHYAASLTWPAGRIAADAAEFSAKELFSREQMASEERVTFRAPRGERVQQLIRDLSARCTLAQAGK